MFSLDALSAASDLVHRWVPPTPQFAWPLLAEATGSDVWVKHENHTPAGAFKVRGGLVYAHRLRDERPAVTELVSATRGNHGQSVAFAAGVTGLRATIVVPHGNSREKNAAMRAFGADLVEHGHDFQAAREHAAVLADRPGAELVPSFHPDLVLGVATYALEFLTAVSGLDTVYVAVGMGSGLCGLIRTRDLLGLATEIVGVVAQNAPATKLSVEAGEVVTTDTAATFVDGVATRVPDATAVHLIAAGAARIIAISEDEAADAMRLMYAATHNVAEPAGALALAGLMAERDRQQGRRVGVIHSGGNVDADVLAAVLTGATPRP